MIRNEAKPIMISMAKTVPGGLQAFGVFVVVPAERLEGRLKAVVQVGAEEYHRDHIQGAVDIRLESRRHIVRHGRFRAEEAMFDKEGFEVNDEEDEDDRAGRAMLRENQLLLPEEWLTA